MIETTKTIEFKSKTICRRNSINLEKITSKIHLKNVVKTSTTNLNSIYVTIVIKLNTKRKNVLNQQKNTVNVNAIRKNKNKINNNNSKN